MTNHYKLIHISGGVGVQKPTITFSLIILTFLPVELEHMRQFHLFFTKLIKFLQKLSTRETSFHDIYHQRTSQKSWTLNSRHFAMV